MTFLHTVEFRCYNVLPLPDAHAVLGSETGSPRSPSCCVYIYLLFSTNSLEQVIDIQYTYHCRDNTAGK